MAPPGTTGTGGGAVVGADGLPRCPWATGHDVLGAYHDAEWGRVLHGRDALFERISLEGFQSGLSWLVVLRKRPAFRAAFADFDAEAVADFDETDVARLVADAGIVRNRAKIVATRDNARAVLACEESGPGLDALLWSFAPAPPLPRPATVAEVPATSDASRAMADALRGRGFRFVGPTTCHALMAATGMVDDHVAGCATAPAGPGDAAPGPRHAG